jgi:hypothetical protein
LKLKKTSVKLPFTFLMLHKVPVKVQINLSPTLRMAQRKKPGLLPESWSPLTGQEIVVQAF